MSKLAFNVRILICILTIIFPILLWAFGGSEPDSYSQYYYTNAAPVFVFVLLGVSFKMMSTPKWFIPGALLLLVIFFPCNEYRLIHNFSAILFYLISSLIICRDKRLYVIGWIMIAASPLYFNSLYWAEVIETTFLAMFHLLYLLRISKAQKG